jgi:Acetyltransferase (GNAT) domain
MEAMSDPWICRPYRDGDESGLCDLYREVFQLDFTPEFWRWAFRDSPDGSQILSLIEMNGKIAGQYAVQPRKFLFRGELCLAGYAGGTMLAPWARNVKTLVEMAKLAYEISRQRGLSWLYCCPNAQALPVRRTLLNWHQLPDLVEWEGMLPANPTPVQGSVRTWTVMPDNLSFERVLEATASPLIYSQRSTAWIRWRFFQRPGGEYVLHTLDQANQVTGYAITKRYNREGVLYGHIVDWQLSAAAGAEGQQLLSSVWRQLGEWNVSRVSSWVLGDPILANLLGCEGLTESGRKSHLCWYDLVHGNDAILAEPSNWRLVMADCDVY